jgi:hypothetical protein
VWDVGRIGSGGNFIFQMEKLSLGRFMFLMDRVAICQIIVGRSDSGTNYTATEWHWDRLYCDGVEVGQVIL